MKSQCLSSDIISTLPESIIKLILTHVPFRDAVRTSILSKKWRYSWVNLPKLVFDDTLLDGSRNGVRLSSNYKVLCTIYQVLLRLRGPILEFTLSTSKLFDEADIDQIILYLSKTNTVEKLTLDAGCTKYFPYTLPSSLFSLQHLTHVYLHDCELKPPSTFNGFTRLKSLYLNRVQVTAEVLEDFISKCPVLKSFTLVQVDEGLLTGEDGDNCSYNFIELLGCSMIEYLHMDSYPMAFFAIGWTAEMLLSSLVHLKILNFSGFSFKDVNELCYLLCYIQSFPNLKKIKIDQTCFSMEEDAVDSLQAFDELPDNFRLDHFEELEIKRCINLISELEFVKRILAISPMLKKVVLEHLLSVDQELKMLKDLIQLPRASATVKFFFHRVH